METHSTLLVTIGNLISCPACPFREKLGGGLFPPLQPNICRSSRGDYFPAWAALVFAGPDGFVFKLFFGSNPVLDNFSPLPFAEMLIFICFGFDSSSFAMCRVKTPLL